MKLRCGPAHVKVGCHSGKYLNLMEGDHVSLGLSRAQAGDFVSVLLAASGKIPQERGFDVTTLTIDLSVRKVID